MNIQSLKFTNGKNMYTITKQNIGKSYTCIVVFENGQFIGLLDIPPSAEMKNILLEVAIKIKKDVTFLEKTHA